MRIGGLASIVAVAMMLTACGDSTGPDGPRNSAPQLAAIPALTVMAGETEEVTITATDADGDSLTFSIPTNPGFLSITGVSQSGNTTTATLVVAPAVGVHGSFDARIRVSDAAGAVDEEGCHVEVPAMTALFLREDDALSNGQASQGVTSVYVYGAGTTVEWRALLNEDLIGSTYGFTLWLGAGTDFGQTGYFDVTLIATRDGVATQLATTRFTVPYNQQFVRYSTSVTGQTGGAAGDKLTLRLTLGGVSKGGILFGAGDVDSHVLVPGAVTVGPAPADVDRVEVSPSGFAIYQGESIQLTATVLDAEGDTLTGREVEWSSSDPSVATVDATGLVVGVGPGSVSIAATSEGQSGTAEIGVVQAPIADWSQAAEWVTFQGNAAHTGYVKATLDPRIFQELWVKTVASDPLNPPTAGDGGVYVSTGRTWGTQTLTALDAQTGATRWSHDFGGIHTVHPPAVGNGTVYVTTGGHGDSYLWAFDAANGTIFFNSSYGNQWSSYYAPVVLGGAVYMAGGYYGGMYRFDAATGDEQWFISLNQYDEWTPAVRDGLVYAYTGEYSPKVSVVDAASGSLVYEIPDPNFDWSGWSMRTAPVLGDLDNLLAIQNGRLISFDLQGQAVGWERTGSYSGNVTVANGELYVINGGLVEARAESDGALIWVWDPPQGSPSGRIVATDNLLFVTTTAETYAVDIGTRYPMWTYPAAGHLALSAQGILFIARENGSLVAIDVR